MPKLQKRIPKLCKHHKGQAFVKLDGRQIWLGRYGEPATLEAYNRLVAEYLINGRQLPTPAATESEPLTVSMLILDYLTYCERMNSEASTYLIRHAMKPLRKLYGSTRAATFGPKSLEVVRQTWIDAKLARKTINELTRDIRRMFRWAASRELVPATVWKALDAVEGLRMGQGGKESKPVRAVEQERIDAIEPHVSRQAWALVQLQQFTGARGGELFGLTLADLDMSGDVWLYQPDKHKTAHHGRGRTIVFGPQAQAVIRRFMPRAIDAPLFSPREANAERKRIGASGSRRRNQKPNPTKTVRTIREAYDAASYRAAIRRACKAAGVERWHPHQLRHTFATRIRRQFGLEVSRLLLGHSDLAVTQIYAEADRERAVEVIREVG